VQIAHHHSLFDRMFALHQEPIRRFCLRRLPVNDVNDAVSEVFVVAWKKIDRSPEPELALPWLYGIARNVVSNATRSRLRLGRLRAKMSGMRHESPASPERQVVRREEDQEALNALERLRPVDREILRLKVWQELTNIEIGSVLDLTPNAVAVRFSRARNRLAAELDIYTDTSTTWTTTVHNGEGAS